MKYSIIVPVYNVEDYLKKCLKSLINQNYDNYEIIIVNDGSTDDSQKLIDEFQKKYPEKIKSFKKKNGGLSDARNFALKYVTGDYMIFCDSDDYLECELLLNINKVVTSRKYDVIKFLFNIVDENGNTIKKEISNIDGNVNFENMITLEYANSACCYAFKTDFWRKHGFKFANGKVHEDFGLIPLILLLSDDMYVMNEVGYNYLMRKQSITNGSEKNIRRVNDMLWHYDNLLKQVNKYNISEKNMIIFKSYISNGIIGTSKLLTGNDFNEYIEELKKRKVCNNLAYNSLKRIVKKILLKTNIKFFISFFY